ncbi:ArsI/CadI family heavy metal resistance metalloenzyme [Viridibacterium curvum]|uniref:ArsI/CadI family heavy metal resistance metalloenzyme n=1 Tax=Viridibacterium curvum TaxID=1101404 RepID=A0ABP9Q9U8_9RHOO
MKRFHIHVSVADLTASVRFYSSLFGREPALLKADYAKWMLEDPRINFAISQRGAAVGLDHLGIQVDSAEELAALQVQFQSADSGAVSESGTACCYAESDKHWAQDPDGIAWEAYHTLASIPTFNRAESTSTSAACCAPKATSQTVPIAAIKTTSQNHCAPGGGCC